MPEPIARIGGERAPASIVPPPNNLPYIIAVVTVILLVTAAIVMLTVLLPNRDNLPIISVIVGLAAPTTLSLLAFMKAQETHLSVNSRLDGFMRNAESAALARGQLEGLTAGALQADIRTDTLRVDAAIERRHAGQKEDTGA